MKTVSKNSEILRLQDSDADLKVKSGWNYTSKSEWKQKVRDINKKQKTEAEKADKKEKTKKEKKSS
jgi:hypothetical protein